MRDVRRVGIGQPEESRQCDVVHDCGSLLMTKHVPANPNTNKLPAGIAEADVHSAITQSGYPLQNIAGDYCEKAGFRTIEEWSYLDKDAEPLRTIDVKAEKPLFEYQKGSETKIRPNLILLIECKQSELPYVFFLSQRPIRVSHFRSSRRAPQTSLAVVTTTSNPCPSSTH